MPYKQRIADVDRQIEETMAALIAVRAAHAEGKLSKKDAEPRINKLLANLARFKAEKMRLALLQRNSVGS